MVNFKYHTIYSICATVLICALLTPSVVKLSHLFQGHKHEVCVETQASHYHEYEVDCDFYKFNKTTQFHLNDYKDFTFYTPLYKIVENSFYNHLISHRQLSFSLRAPPQLLV